MVLKNTSDDIVDMAVRTVKVVLPEGDIRRFSLTTGQGVSYLTGLLKGYVAEHEQEICLRYVDDEGEKITVSCDEELEEAFLLCKEEQRRTLKLFASKLDLLAGNGLDDAGLYELADLGSDFEYEDEVKTPKAAIDDSADKLAPPSSVDSSVVEPPRVVQVAKSDSKTRTDKEQDTPSDDVTKPDNDASPNNSIVIVSEDEANPEADKRIFGDVLDSNNPSLAASLVSSVASIDTEDEEVKAGNLLNVSCSPHVVVNDAAFVSAVHESMATMSGDIAALCKAENLGLHDTMRVWLAKVFSHALKKVTPEVTRVQSLTDADCKLSHDQQTCIEMPLHTMHSFEKSVEAIVDDVSRLQSEPSWETVAQNLADLEEQETNATTPTASLILLDMDGKSELHADAKAIATELTADITDTVNEVDISVTDACPSAEESAAHESDRKTPSHEEDALSLLEMTESKHTTEPKPAVAPELQMPDNFPYKEEAESLVEMGFTEMDLNCLLLSRNNGNLDRVIEWLLNKPSD